MVAHSSLTGADLHEPKGVATAGSNTVYVADGAGSGNWESIDGSVIASSSDLSVATVTTTGVVTIAGVKIVAGTGTPEGVVTAPVGSLYLRLDGGASTTLYVKQSGTGTTGWTAK